MGHHSDCPLDTGSNVVWIISNPNRTWKVIFYWTLSGPYAFLNESFQIITKLFVICSQDRRTEKVENCGNKKRIKKQCSDDSKTTKEKN